MIDEVLTADPDFPDHLHRHIVQNWLIKHRRPPRDEQDRRRAVAEYLVRGAKDRTGLTRVLAGPAPSGSPRPTTASAAGGPCRA